MLDQDASASTIPPSSGGLEPDAISQWKSSVQEFFTREWDNLRDLIRQLEEHDWDDATLAPPQDAAETARPFHARILEEITARPEPQPVSQPVAPQPDRLADLAKRLEGKLKRKADDV